MNLNLPFHELLNRRHVVLGMGLFLGLAALAGLIVQGQFIVIAAAAGALFLYLAFARPQLAIWLMAVYTIFEETLLRWLPTELRFAGEAGLLILLGITILKQLRRDGRIQIRRTPIDVLLILFILVGLISTLFNRSPFIVFILGMRPWLRYVALFYVITWLDWPDGLQRRFMWGLFGVAVIQASIGLLQSAGGESIAGVFTAPDVEIGGRFTQQIDPGIIGTKIFGTMARYDRFGNYMMLMLIFGIAAIPSVRSNRRLLLLGGIGAISLGLLLSFSRQAWVAAGIGVILLLIIDKRVMTLVSGLIILAILLSIFLLMDLSDLSAAGGNPSPVTTRLLEPFGERYWEDQHDIGGRAYYVLTIGPLILEHSPWLGFGPGRFGSLVTKVIESPVYDELNIPSLFYERYSQDIQWLAMMGQVGLIGLTLFILMIIRLGLQAFRQYRRLGSTNFKGMLALTFLIWCVGIIFVSLLGPNVEVRAISMYFWTLAGLTTVNASDLRNESHENSFDQ